MGRKLCVKNTWKDNVIIRLAENCASHHLIHVLLETQIFTRVSAEQDTMVGENTLTCNTPILSQPQNLTSAASSPLQKTGRSLAHSVFAHEQLSYLFVLRG